MASIQLLKRPKTAVSCGSCRERFDTTDLLAAHLQQGRVRAICTRTKGATVLSCIHCERDFPDVERLKQHFIHSSVHNEELTKPTGRCIYVGRLAYGVTEQKIKDELFAGYIIETTSMLTHCEALGKFTNFAFINLSTTVEAERAVKQLNSTHFYGSRIVVQPQKSNAQKSNTTSGGASNGHQRSRAIVTSDTHSHSRNENMSHQDTCKQQSLKGKQPRDLVTDTEQVVGLRGGAAQFRPVHAQQHVMKPPLPSHHEFQPPHMKQKAPVSYDQAPQQIPQRAVATQQQGWPPLVSSGPNPEPRNWTIFSADQILLVADALANHCHNTSTLSAAGFNVSKPIKPAYADLQARVKCKHCRQTRKRIGNNACSVSRDMRHVFPGVSHIEARYLNFDYAPPSSQAPKRFAICLDCEMAGAWNGDGFLDELIQLTAIDYLTGEVLISTLVAPTLHIRQWRTQIHGVSNRTMSEAISQGAALNGYKAARDLLFEFMDTNTILVGHAVHNDLNVLKIVHTRCVDSEILATMAVDAGCKQWGLKMLCEGLPQVAVQRGTSHDCLEDSFAAREAVLCMTLRPDIVARWVLVQQVRLRAVEAERQANRDEKEAARISAAMEADAMGANAYV